MLKNPQPECSRQNAEGICAFCLQAAPCYGQDADIQAALDAGFDEHVTKPPDPERLERILGTGMRDDEAPARV